jgi:nucleoside-diphosphate kinase
MALETTLILFKPDAIEKNLTGKVLARFQDAGFVIRGIKMMQLDDTILREHYSHVADKPFFPEIVAFMSRTPTTDHAGKTPATKQPIKRYRHERHHQ